MRVPHDIRRLLVVSAVCLVILLWTSSPARLSHLFTSSRASDDSQYITIGNSGGKASGNMGKAEALEEVSVRPSAFHRHPLSAAALTPSVRNPLATADQG